MSSDQHHYFDLVKKAVYGNDEASSGASAGYITAMTKAYLKDGAVNHALKLFEEEVQKLRDLKQKREDILIAMFDSVFGEVHQAESQLSYEKYKSKYLDMIALGTDLMKESYTVNQLQRIIKDKDFNEIETLFQLYLVKK
jgi:hypothetical protein